MTKTITLLFVLIPMLSTSQNICFFNPNTGPHCHNGSSGANYDGTAGDFNEDGNLDVVTANSTASNVSFVPGNGDGTLGAPDTFSVGGTTLFCITSADFNQDGHLDIALGESLNIFIMAGDGNGSFQLTGTYSGGHSSRIYTTDFNSDGNTDLVETAMDGLHILMGKGNGQFDSTVNYATGGEAIDVAIADFDGDKILDLVTTTRVNLSTSVLSFLKGNGNGSFQSFVAISVPHVSIFGINTLDLDQDGAMDLIVSNSNNKVNRMEVYLGNGDGSFQSPQFYPTSYDPVYVYLADMDSDGTEDVVVIENGGFTVLKNNMDGTLGTYQYFQAVPAPNGLAIGDFDGDSKPDVVVPSAYWGSGIIVMQLNCNTVGIEKPSGLPAFKLYPNPGISILILSADAPFVGYTVYDERGRKVLESTSLQSRSEIDISGLAAGNYFIDVVFERGTRKASRLTKIEGP